MRCLTLVWIAIALTAAGARADFVTEGAFSAASRYSTNYNTQFDPANSTGPTYTLVTSGSLPSYRDFRGSGSFGDASLKFALGAAIPVDATILSATLSLHVATSLPASNGQAPILGVAGFAATADFVSLSDFDQLSTAIGTPQGLGGLGYFSSGNLTFDATSFLQTLQANGSALVGFQLDNPTNGLLVLSSLDDGNPVNRPSLTITYAAAVPEPTSAALVLVGLALGAARRRRIGAMAA